MRWRRIILVTTGTKGDLNPFLALGRRLLDRGLAPVIASNFDHEQDARRLGLPFVGISPPDHGQCNRDMQRFKAEVKDRSRDLTYRYLVDMAREDPEFLILCRTDNMMSVACAQRFDIPYAIVNLQPQAIVNPWEPHGIHDAWRVRLYNECRARNGLPIVDGTIGAISGAAFVLSLFPVWYGMPQAALWSAGHVVGFPFLETPTGNSDRELQRFLEGNTQPIVFVSGTGVSDVAGLCAHARETCRIAAKPGIFITSHLDESGGTGDTSDFLIRRDVDLGELLASAALIVHHGGIGTTAQAIRAGLPQIVRPVAFDQPDNALRIVAHGLGRADDRHMPARDLASLIQQVLDDQPMRARLDAASAMVKADDAPTTVCEIVERFVASK